MNCDTHNDAVAALSRLNAQSGTDSQSNEVKRFMAILPAQLDAIYEATRHLKQSADSKEDHSELKTRLINLAARAVKLRGIDAEEAYDKLGDSAGGGELVEALRDVAVKIDSDNKDIDWRPIHLEALGEAIAALQREGVTLPENFDAVVAQWVLNTLGVGSTDSEEIAILRTALEQESNKDE